MTAMEDPALTPMLKQYFEIKKQHPDALLFFRMGDFYEMFFEDAKVAAPILEVVLTTRNKSKENAVPLCGVPYHALGNYAGKLLKKGFKIAICDQVEDPRLAKGLVKREITRILTPGTALEIDAPETEVSNFVVALVGDERTVALASVDLAAAEFEIRCYPRGDSESHLNELVRKFPREIIIPQRDVPGFAAIRKRFPELEDALVTQVEDMDLNYFACEEVLRRHFGLETIEGLGLGGYPPAVIAAGALLRYLQTVRKTALKNISAPHFAPAENYLILDAVTFKNLEIVANLRTGTAKGSLLEAVDFTLTPMGKRLLKKWLSYPLIDPREIDERLDGVEEFSQNLISRSEVRKRLRAFGDIAKLNSKIALEIAQPQHLLSLHESLRRIPEIRRELEVLRSPIIAAIAAVLDPLPDVCTQIERAIEPEAAAVPGEGRVIRSGYNLELDELRQLNRHAKEIIATMEKSEREKTGIPSLKVRFNRVFGYFIDVTKPHLRLVPDHYIRKQTLVNSERFITQELKELEDKILKAEEQIAGLENRLYQELIRDIQGHSRTLNRNAEQIARLDVLAGGGELAQRRRYVRPQIDDGRQIRISEGRHPVLEAGAASEASAFIPNDLDLSADGDQILVITGPNMGGKSTYLRQNALMVILAQAGYFVPAAKAQIGLCDRIFTRIGASDALIEGKSTFLVEMIETAVILNNATSRSLILLDEIGRGTSTFDGLSIAWAVVEHIHSLREKPRTLFATHYHELTEMAYLLERIKNYHIAVREWQDQVIFLHKIVPGATDQSFGIHVAKIAGIPVAVIERAKEILLNLEKKELSRLVKERLTGKLPPPQAENRPSPSLFPEDLELRVWDELRTALREIDISRLTPLEALNILQNLKLKSDKLS